MTLFGQDKAVSAFRSAMDGGTLHHAWLLAGPRGVGKSSFAMLAATRLLADAAGPKVNLPALETPVDHPTARLMAANSHPDFRLLKRELNDKGDALRRSITVDQVRKLGDLFAVAPAMSEWRAVVIDSIDDMERNAANALLKMLEEPPGRSVFFLVSHAPGRLLPTIRSRCRRLAFDRLGDTAMTSALVETLPEASASDRDRLLALAQGSPGRAMNLAELDLAPLEEEAVAIMRSGDPTNARRAKLAGSLALKGSAPRYAAFLELAPSLIAREVRERRGSDRLRALDAYDRARETASLAPRLSLDQSATVFQLGTILASVAGVGADG